MTLILIYLLPILFMLHEFEEMVMLPAWIEKNEKELSRRFPALRSKLSFLQSPAFGIAVCEEFVIVSACTMATIITGNMLFWYICLLAFSLHFVAHIIQFFIIRKYIPAIVSTVLCLPYCVMAISAGQEQYSNVENALLGVLSLVICISNLCIMQIVTPRLYKWINTTLLIPGMCISPKKRSQFEGNVGNPTKRNWKLGGIIKNKCYLCKGNRKNRIVQPI